MAHNYSPLQENLREIRVLSIYPAESQDPEIRCSIHHTSLDSPIEYCALSYVWGERNPEFSVLVDGLRIPVTQNLYSALMHLRTAKIGSHLWIDALCINQNDPLEKSSQVNMMGDIYRRSKQTFVWLGEEDGDSELAMQLLTSVSGNDQVGREEYKRDERIQQLLENSLGQDLDKSWIALRKLFQRPYWGRVWVIQEILLSHPTVLYCGSLSCRWEDVHHLLHPSNFKQYNLTSHFARTALLDRNLLPKLFVEIFVRHKQGESTTFLDYLLLSRQRSTSDPHDKIFGLLGLTTKRLLEADYTQSVEDVYIALVKRWILREQNLDILSTCCEKVPISATGIGSQDYQNKSALPSWVPDWRIPFSKDYQLFPLCHASQYNTDDSRAPVVQYSSDTNTIQIQGVIVDTISLISPDLNSSRWPQVAQDWSTWSLHSNSNSDSNVHSQTPYGDINAQRSAFRSTLYLSLSDSKDKYDGADKFFDIATRRRDQENVDSNAIAEPGPGERTYGTAGRQFFCTSKGFMGRGLHGIMSGDLVVVLMGAKVPFVIRESEMKDCFYLIGECYVHGIMSGEAIREIGIESKTKILTLI